MAGRAVDLHLSRLCFMVLNWIRLKRLDYTRSWPISDVRFDIQPMRGTQHIFFTGLQEREFRNKQLEIRMLVRLFGRVVKRAACTFQWIHHVIKNENTLQLQ